MEGMTFYESAECEEKPSPSSMFFHCIYGIFRAGWKKTATMSHKRTQCSLIKANQKNKDFPNEIPLNSSFFYCFFTIKGTPIYAATPF
jgi:hypothetical protein